MNFESILAMLYFFVNTFILVSTTKKSRYQTITRLFELLVSWLIFEFITNFS